MTSVKKLSPRSVAFQGEPGAYSDLACRAVFPAAKTLPCASFDAAFAAVSGGKADLAMIPIENSLAGRVGDVHHLLPDSGLFIIGEHFEPIRHCLLGVKGAKISQIIHVHSHVMALPQCRRVIRSLKLKEIVHADTAGAAAQVAQEGRKDQAAIASSLAGEIYGLQVLKKDIQDSDDNVTRFIIISRDHVMPKPGAGVITSFAYGVRNIPAVLYKSLGGFATNQVNMIKIESYLGNAFKAAEFYCEVEGHPDEPRMKLAFEELSFFGKDIRMLGTYTAHKSRAQKK